MTSAPTAPADPRLRLKILAAFATIYLVWGSTFLAIRIGVRQLPPLLQSSPNTSSFLRTKVKPPPSVSSYHSSS